MKRQYLTDCATGHTPEGPPGALALQRRYAASVTLSAPGLHLVFAPLPTELLLSMARVFVGPTGDAASISDAQPNALKTAPDGRLLVDDVLQTACPTDFSTVYQLAK